MIAVSLCVCFTTHASRQRREQEEERRQREQNDESVYSVNDSNVDLNPNLNVGTWNLDVKIPYLPEYTPRTEPPSYEQIAIGTADKAGDQVYDELIEVADSNIAQANIEAENMAESGEVNKAFENEETENETKNENE